MKKIFPMAWHVRKMCSTISIEAVSAVTGKDSGDDFKAVEDLHQLSGVDIPAAVDGLERAEVRHKTVVAAADMQKAVESYLGV